MEEKRDLIAFISDAVDDIELLKEFAQCPDHPEALKTFFSNKGYIISEDLEEILKTRKKIGLNTWPLPPYY